MSKRAEEAALEAYPVHSVLIQPARRGGYYADGHLREGFIKGYELAEKDFALIWEDVKAICDIEGSMYPHGIEMYSKEYYEEVLKRFNELKITKK